MSRWFVVMIAFLLWIRAADPVDLAAAASAAYGRGDYPTAAAAYEQIAAQGGEGGTLRYNLATVYRQMGDMGRAILNYRRAFRWLPRDVDVLAGLAVARSQRVDVMGDEQGFAVGIADIFASILTPEETLWLIWGMVDLIVLAAFLMPFKGNWRRGLRRLQAVSFGVGVLLAAALCLRGWFDSQRPVGVVIEEQVISYSGPGTDYLELYDLHAGAELRSIVHERGWVRFELPDGREGWLPESAIEDV
jgi:tetratricopeptide (TPR) repeat protein